MSAVEIDGSLIHYETVGRGQPILFLHGWLGSWRYWMSTMEALSHKYRAYALDLWGFGASDKSQARYRVPDYVTLVDKFVSKLGINNPLLVGHALGAVVVLEYAVCYPQRVEKMMVVSLPLNSGCINRPLLGFAHNFVLTRMMRWWQRIAYKDMQQEAEKTDDRAIRISLQSVAQMDIHRRLRSICHVKDILLLAVYGERDDVIGCRPTCHVAESWPNIRLMSLSRSKHFPMLDEGSKFGRLLQDFLEVEDNLSDLELKEEWRRRTH
jgi:pimeloyl-ACP methyl ester carboxylesterase